MCQFARPPKSRASWPIMRAIWWSHYQNAIRSALGHGSECICCRTTMSPMSNLWLSSNVLHLYLFQNPSSRRKVCHRLITSLNSVSFQFLCLSGSSLVCPEESTSINSNWKTMFSSSLSGRTYLASACMSWVNGASPTVIKPEYSAEWWLTPEHKVWWHRKIAN